MSDEDFEAFLTADDDEALEVRRWMFARVEQTLLYEYLKCAPPRVVDRLLAVLTPKIRALVGDDLEFVEPPDAARRLQVRAAIAQAVAAIRAERRALPRDLPDAQ